MNRRRIFETFQQAHRPETVEWVLLAEAARAVRAALRGSDLDLMSRGLGETEESLLSFWAHRVAQMGVPIHGYRIQSDKLEIIPEAVIQAGRINSEATRLETEGQQTVNDFGALQVKRHELEAALARAGEDGTAKSSAAP